MPYPSYYEVMRASRAQLMAWLNNLHNSTNFDEYRVMLVIIDLCIAYDYGAPIH